MSMLLYSSISMQLFVRKDECFILKNVKILKVPNGLENSARNNVRNGNYLSSTFSFHNTQIHTPCNFVTFFSSIWFVFPNVHCGIFRFDHANYRIVQVQCHSVEREKGTEKRNNIIYICSVVVESLSHVSFFAILQTAALQASLSFTLSLNLLRFTSIESTMLSNYLILCHLLLLLPSIFPSIKVFSNESALHIRWSEYWSFSFIISPSNEYSGLISFRIGVLEASPAPQFEGLNSSALSLLYGPTYLICT